VVGLRLRLAEAAAGSNNHRGPTTRALGANFAGRGPPVSAKYAPYTPTASRPWVRYSASRPSSPPLRPTQSGHIGRALNRHPYRQQGPAPDVRSLALIVSQNGTSRLGLRLWQPVAHPYGFSKANLSASERLAVMLGLQLAVGGRNERMDPSTAIDPITAAIATGAAAGLTGVATQAVKDGYGALKSGLRARFPKIDVGPLEERPSSQAKKASLAEDLDEAGAVRDPELLQLARTLVEVIDHEAPQAAASAGVDLQRVKAEFLNVQRVGRGVRFRDVEATKGGINITDVDQAGGRDPNS
jgi:hypothetical protein